MAMLTDQDLASLFKSGEPVTDPDLLARMHALGLTLSARKADNQYEPFGASEESA